METDLIEFMTEQLGGKEAVAEAYAKRQRPLHVQMTFPSDLAARIMEEMGEDDYPSDVVVRVVARYFLNKETVIEVEAHLLRTLEENQEIAAERDELKAEVEKLEKDAICVKSVGPYTVGKHYEAEAEKTPLGGEDFFCELSKDGQFLPFDAPEFIKPDYKMSKGFATFRDGSWYCISTSIDSGNSKGCAKCGVNLPGLGSIEGLRVVCEDCMISAKEGEE